MSKKPLIKICRLLLFCAGLTVWAEAAFADFEIHPSITISEEFTDNVYENRKDKKSDYITRAMPGLQFRYAAPVGTVDGEYRYDYHYYLRQSRKDDDTHYANVNAHLSVIDEVFFLDAGDNYQRVSLDVSRDVTQESLFINQTDQNNLTASPYFNFNLSPRISTRFGYRYANIWFQQPDRVQGQTALDLTNNSRREHTGFGELGYQMGDTAKLTGGYAIARTTRHSGTSTQQDSYLALEKKYGPNDQSVFSLRGGWTSIKYQQSRRYNAPFWSAGLKHQIGNIVTSLNTRVFYGEDPLRAITKETSYSGAVDLLLPMGTVGALISYARFDDTALDRLVTKRSTAALRGRYDLMSYLAADMTIEVARYDNNSVTDTTGTLFTGESDTRRLLVAPSLSYTFGEGMTVSAHYRYVNYFSGFQGEVNRIALEFKKVF